MEHESSMFLAHIYIFVIRYFNRVCDIFNDLLNYTELMMRGFYMTFIFPLKCEDCILL